MAPASRSTQVRGPYHGFTCKGSKRARGADGSAEEEEEEEEEEKEALVLELVAK